MHTWLPEIVTSAAQRNDIQKLHELVTQDPGLAQLRAREGSFTLLHKCANNDSPDILPVIDLLVSCGADVNARDYTYRGASPLHMACSEHGLPRNVSVAERLLAAGADPNAQTITSEDIALYQTTHTLFFTGLAPLHLALRQASSDLIALLIRSGASPVLHTSEQGYGSPIDSARSGDWQRHLPELLRAPLDYPRTLTVKLKTLEEEPPAAFQCEYTFLDPQTTPVHENMAERRARLPATRMEEAAAPDPGEERALSPKIEVPLAADGLPCNFQLEIRAAGPERRMQYGFYAGSPIRYAETMMQASPVNFRKGADHEFQNVMFRKGGETMLSNFRFSVVISAE